MDLINRKELIRQIQLQANRSSLGETSYRELTFGEVAYLITEAPTVEVEPVIYCKDCVSHRELDEEEIRILKDNHVYCNRINKYMPEKGFCSLGDSRDGD